MPAMTSAAAVITIGGYFAASARTRTDIKDHRHTDSMENIIPAVFPESRPSPRIKNAPSSTLPIAAKRIRVIRSPSSRAANTEIVTGFIALISEAVDAFESCTYKLSASRNPISCNADEYEKSPQSARAIRILCIRQIRAASGSNTHSAIM